MASRVAEKPPAPDPAKLYVPDVGRVDSVRRLTERESLFTFLIDRPKGLQHTPGQFIHIHAFGIGEAPISVSSPPGQTENFELCIRRAGSVTGALHLLRPGDRVGIRGPFGKGYDVEALKGRDILFVAGGLGLAPLRSLIKHVIDEKQRKEFGNITILCGAKQPTELLFTEELEAWQARKDIRCEVTVDVRDALWQGNVGVITTLLPKLKALDFRNTVAAICGPPVMYKFVTVGLLELGLPEGHIYLSLERNMKCGIGKCGHCQVNNIYVCREGPVFNYTRLKPLPESMR